jgi:hypothetical protein
MPGLYTDSTLDTLGLAILVEYKILYCVLCLKAKNDSFGLPNVCKKVSLHLSEHTFQVKDPQIAQALDTLEQYNAWEGTGDKIHDCTP